MRLAIVADDLTGAMDTGVQLAKGGLHTLIVLTEGDLPDAEAIVASTDSRNEKAEIAYRRAKEIAIRLRGCAVYKKIDSTFRGNIGSEIDGLLDGLGMERALVAPAFPATGRTTVDGYQKVNGVPISETAFARDPFWPITESYLPTLLSRQTRRRVGRLHLSTVEMGEEAVREALEAENADIVVADAVEPAHLRSLAGAMASLRESWLPCGSAGLAEEWPWALGLRREAGVSLAWAPDPRPALVVAGSRHPSTALQLQRAAQETGLELVLLPGEGRWTEASLGRAASLLQRGRSVALATTFSEYREGQGNAVATDLARAAGEVISILGHQTAAERSREVPPGSAGKLPARPPKGSQHEFEAGEVPELSEGGARTPIAGILTTGGDVARAVCRELGATSLRALGEIQPGIPAGLLVGGQLDGVRVVTKAGGFGDELAIARSIQTLRGRMA